MRRIIIDPGRVLTKMDIDSKDVMILNMLSIDARLSMTEMARRLGMTRTAVRYRLRELEDDGIIEGYTVIVNPLKFDSGLYAEIRIEVKPINMVKVINLLKETKEVVEVYRLSSPMIICARVYFRNSSHRNNFILTKLEHLPIESYDLQPIVQMVKHTGLPL
jgi:DNA-binding Lrp family transcriptional regulator